MKLPYKNEENINQSGHKNSQHHTCHAYHWVWSILEKNMTDFKISIPPSYKAPRQGGIF